MYVTPICFRRHVTSSPTEPQVPHLLAQIPLTVSPYTRLPKVPTLPHNYTSLPSTLPPSCIQPPHTSIQNPSNESNTSDLAINKAAYVTSSSGFAAHPSTIIAQNAALLSSLQQETKDAIEKYKKYKDAIQKRDLAEKRRKAPGWLDRDEKILMPQSVVGPGGVDEQKDVKAGNENLLDQQDEPDKQVEVDDLGAQMERAFG